MAELETDPGVHPGPGGLEGLSEPGPGPVGSGVALVSANADHGYSSTPTTEDPGLGELNHGHEDPPVDWFEPLEEDDDTHSGQHLLRRDEEEEEEEEEGGSIAAESEKSGSLASEEKRVKRIYRFNKYRTSPNEGWEDCRVLGDGWKRRQVVRRSGSSIGQRDVYYVGPHGERVRSKVELAAVLGHVMDIDLFDFKMGVFTQEPRPARRIRRKIRERLSSESSCVEKEDGGGAPDPRRLATPPRRFKKEPGLGEDATPSAKRNSMSPKSPLTCSGCGSEFIGTAYDQKRKKPRCPSCWSARMKTHPTQRTRRAHPAELVQIQPRLAGPAPHHSSCPEAMEEPTGGGELRFGFEVEVTDRLVEQSSDTEDSVNIGPDDEDELMSNEEYDEDDEDWPKHRRRRRACGACASCLSVTDCGACDFCIDKPKFGGRNTKRQKCRLRQCSAMAKLGPARHKPRYTYSRKPHSKGPPDPPWAGPGARGPGARGQGQQRLTATHRTPQPHGAGRPAPSSLQTHRTPQPHGAGRPAPSSLQTHRTPQPHGAGRPAPSSLQTHRTPQPHGAGRRAPSSLQTPEAERLPRRPAQAPHRTQPPQQVPPPPESSLRPTRDPHLRPSGGGGATPGVEEETETPAITQIFSLAQSQARRAVDVGRPLYRLLEELRAAALPILWYAILVEGPRLQIIQCAKQSRMADTAVLVEPDFGWRVTVQRQPLLPCHPLYEQHAPLMSSVGRLVKLLLDLESYAVCQGIAAEEGPGWDGPIILDRALICDFLVAGPSGVCASCRALCPAPSRA